MKLPFAFLLALLAGVLPWSISPAGAQQSVYAPVAVAGFTDDVVVNGPAPATASATNPVDQGRAGLRFCFTAPDYRAGLGFAPISALPANGLIASAQTPGLTFQLAPYTGLNALRLAGTGTGALTLTAPQAASEIYVLAACGNGDSPVTITATFTDQTSQTFTATVADWFGGGNFAIKGVSRVNFDTNAIENNTDDPRLYEVRLALAPVNASKLLQRLAFTNTSTGSAPILNVMAVSLGRVCVLPTGTIVASTNNICPGQPVQLTLQPLAGSNFSGQWQASTDNGGTWTDVAGAALPTYTATPLVSTQYRVRVSCGTSFGFIGPAAVVVVAPPTTVAYAQASVCQAARTGPAVVARPVGGTFSAPAGLAIDAATGVITPAASALGIYLVTYTTTGQCPGTATTRLAVTPRVPGTLAYSSADFCTASPNPTPVVAPAGGVFSSAGSIIIDPVSGTIDLGRTAAGTYTITYTSADLCTSPATTQVMVTAAPVLVFPNIITPGPDRLNRALHFDIDDTRGYALQVFSRWGRLVWESHNPADGWTAEGNSSGPYFYRVVYVDCARRPQEYHGWVEVVK